MAAISGRLSGTGQPPAMPPSKHLLRPGPSMVFSKYLMNDIPRGTTRVQLMNFLQAEFDPQDDIRTTPMPPMKLPQVHSGCVITDSRLDDELSVAVIEFSDTPIFLQMLNNQTFGFPKKTDLGTLWKGVDMGEIDEDGKSEFMRAVIEGHMMYAETLAEFEDTDVNLQDNNGWTALHWACSQKLTDPINLCLSIPEFDIGLRNKDNLTAFDLSGTELETLAMFYKSMIDMEECDPQRALLRMLTMTSEPPEHKVIFPGEAIFCPIEDGNKPLVKALITRGIDLTAQDVNSDTALHLAVKSTDVDIAIRLMKAGSDVDAIGQGGATPLHYAAETSEKRMVQALLSWDAKPDTRNHQGMRALDLARDPGMVRHELNRKAKDTERLTPLQRAAEDGDTGVVQLLLELGASVDEKRSHGPTALMVAARNGHRAVGELLVDAGANIDTTDKGGRTALDMSSTEGFSGLLRDLGAKVTTTTAVDVRTVENDVEHAEEELNGGTQVDEELAQGSAAVGEESGEIPRPPGGAQSQQNMGLLQAVMESDLAQVSLLLASGASIEESDGVGRTPLYIASRDGHTEIVQALLASGAQTEVPRDSGATPLYAAAENGHTETVQALLASGAHTEAARVSGSTALYVAAQNGHTETVQALLASGAQTEAAGVSGVTPLYIAAQRGHTEIVQALLASGAQTEAALVSGATPLYIAAHNGHTETVQALLASGAQTEAALVSGSTPLFIAAQNGHTETVEALLASGAQTEAARVSGETPLFIAAKNGHTETVQALLASGAQTEAAGVSGATPLFIAAQNGHTETVQALLASGAQTEAALVSGSTPLYIAAQNGHTETVQALLTSGAQTEAARVSGETPLYVAAQNGHTETVQALLASGAQTKVKNSDGQTPLQIATWFGHHEAAQVLRAARRWRLSDPKTWVRRR
ncbi:hypothetical protein Q9L58_009364 [Maublancomyces gigas]|uniref:Uncharacterized protein n=1 Tax=Discina gigas TaxID=1032678 RepID=A0ABR3G766_9PEZI